jgi:regulator of protease activity HflC (stomatin/prohibitin superfamily)
MSAITERPIGKVSGFPMLLVMLALGAASSYAFVMGCVNTDATQAFDPFIAVGLVGLLAFFLLFGGFYIVHPNEAKVFNFFGSYAGTCRDSGFHFTNPFAKRVAVSLRVHNFSSETIKVNDAAGNPIEIAAVIVWQVSDAAKAVLDVQNYENFVVVQSETAIRNLANHFPYDSPDKTHESLRGNPEEISRELSTQLQERLEIAGLTVVETRLSHLSYAPEIAQTMLRRQQAEAIIAARRLIVDGAVGMVHLALESLEKQGVVKLDEERKAAMVNNLLVALVSESEAQPIINTGSLYA